MAYCIHCGQELGAQDRFCGRCGAAVPSPSPEQGPPASLAQDQAHRAMVVAGRYHLEAMLGQGRSGTVYRARDQLTGAVAAVKHLMFDLQQYPDGLERFQAEVALLRRIEHPDVVRVLDTVVDGAEAWLVTELVTGASLRQVLRSAGRLTPEQALGVLAGCLSGVAAAHAAGVVHGDLKPENILVDAATGTSKLADFGQARLHAGSQGTAQGPLGSGTPGYQAPEVVAGAAPGPASDVYALGVVLFECLAGEPPYRAAQAERVAIMHAEDPVPPVPGVAPAVSDLVTAALAKDPAARPTAGALLAHLEQVAEETYGANWRARASLGGLTAVLGAEGAAIATSLAAGTPEAAAARPQMKGGTEKATAHTAAVRRSSRTRAFQAIVAHKAVAAVAAGVVTVGAAAGGFSAATALSSSGPAASTRAVAAAQTTTTTAGQHAASASTTAPTTTTTTPVAVPTSISVTTCNSQVANLSTPAPTAPATAMATVIPAEASGLSFYADKLGLLLVLAPKGWTCDAFDATDGSAGLAVYPPGTAPPSETLDTPWDGTAASPADEEAVTASEDANTTEGAAAACPLFAGAQSPTASQPCGTAPSGEQVQASGLTAVRFTDPANTVGDGDPSGGSNQATGVMIFNPDTATEAPFYQATCTLSTQYQSLCDPTITDFTTRYSGG